MSPVILLFVNLFPDHVNKIIYQTIVFQIIKIAEYITF